MNTQTVIDGVVPPAAPKRTKEMVKAAVLAFIGRHGFDWGNPEQAAAEIADHWRNGMDGYELAKKLELYCCWDVSAQEVEDLDSIDMVVRDAEEEARKAWASEWDIKPPLPIGTRIAQGVIDSVSEYQAAAYFVKQNGCTQDGRFLIVKFEDAKQVGSAS